MDKKKFEKIMDEWVAHEMEAAPDLKPNKQVYQKLEEKKKKPRFGLFSWPIRLAAAGIAAALIILVIVLKPPKEVEPLLGLRKGPVAEKAGKEGTEEKVQVLEEAPAKEEKEIPEEVKRAKLQEEEESLKGEKAEKRENLKQPVKPKVAEKAATAVKDADKKGIVQPGEVAARPRMGVEPQKKEAESKVIKLQMAEAPAAAVSQRMEFQYQPGGSGAVEKWDMNEPQDKALSLSPEDNYRLLLQLPQERYVYVFQVVADKRLVRLFPNADFSPQRNPLQAGKAIVIPPPPDWFYVEKDAGEVFIYVVASDRPFQDWDDIHADYFQSGEQTVRQKRSKGLLDRVEKLRENPEDGVSVRLFKFTVLLN